MIIIKFLLFLGCLSYVSACAEREDWQLWKVTYNKDFSVDEEDRCKVWVENSEYIESHNRGDHTFKLAMNKFGAMTREEFRNYNTFGRNINDLPRDLCVHNTSKEYLNVVLPDSVDWREKGVVTAVKDQGQCGSCWAFSAIGAIESLWAISKNKTPHGFSEQQLVDCSGSEGNYGCRGGLMDSAFAYVKKSGITTEKAYPYKAVDQNCQKFLPVFTVSRCVDFDPIGGHLNDTEHFMEYIVAFQQPISVAVYAGNSFWQFYKSGIIDDPACGNHDDHGVVAIGYGKTDEDKTYWLVKNSWGTDWGMEGYVQVARNKNMCGIAEFSSYPIL